MSETLCQRNLRRWPEMDDAESTWMECQGESPWGGSDNPPLVWCWSEDEDEVLVGRCPEDAEILTYAEAKGEDDHE